MLLVRVGCCRVGALRGCGVFGCGYALLLGVDGLLLVVVACGCVWCCGWLCLCVVVGVMR